ncbi:mitogen-activated protein kinase kinase kinase 14 isoform X2 [Engraulis encrasicolus]
MAVTGRILNSTMPFTQKGTLDKSLYTMDSTSTSSEPDFPLGSKGLGKEPAMDPVSYLAKGYLAKVVTQGTAEQVGSDSFISTKPSGLFIAQAQCESQESQEFSPTFCSHSYMRHIQRPSPPHHSSHLPIPAEPPVPIPAALPLVEESQTAARRRRRRKHRRRRRIRRLEQQQLQQQQQPEGKGEEEVRRGRAHTGVPEQETGEISTPFHIPHSSEGVLSECTNNSSSNSSSSERNWVQETGDPWEEQDVPRPGRSCHPFPRPQQPCLDVDVGEPGPGPSGWCQLAVHGCRKAVMYERDGMEFITPLVEAVLADSKEQEMENINEGLLLHEGLEPVDCEYREGREYSSIPIKSGSYGDVCRVLDKNTGFVCAAKKVPLERFKSVEVGAWSCLHSLPNVVELFGAVREGPDIILFMELKAGSLGQLLEQRGRLPEDLALYYFIQVMGTLDQLHRRQILHMDVKADNVLLSEDGKSIFLCDFGHSEKIDKHGECIGVTTEMKGSESHMAPEVVRSERRSTKSDVWSCCCMLLHMLTGCLPWTRLYSRPLYLTIANEPPPLREIPPDCSLMTAHIIEAGLRKQPTKRLSAAELKMHASKALNAVGGLRSPVQGPYVKPLPKLGRLSPSIASDAPTKPTPAPHPTPPVPSPTPTLPPELGQKKAHEQHQPKTCKQWEELWCGERSHKVKKAATTASQRELRKLERDFYLSSLSQPHSAELQEQLLSCLSSEGPSQLDLWDKKDSGRWSLSPGEDLSSGAVSSDSSSESINMELPVSPYSFGGVNVKVTDFSGRDICIREKRNVSIERIARGISEQISEPVFSLEYMDGHPVSQGEEVQESGVELRCVRAPDCEHHPSLSHKRQCSWIWRINNGHLETND